MIFKGSCTALVTPFSSRKQKINKKVLKKLIDMQIDGGSKAILILGTTGESSTISKDEQFEMADFCVKYVNHRLPVIIGSGSNNTKEAIEKSLAFEKIGADGLLIVSPYYNKTSQNGLTVHYEKIADNVKTPIILYNIPSRTGVNILPETVIRLSKHKNIVGIKEASGNLMQVAEILKNADKDFAVYSGDDALTLPILSLGGHGVISVAGNIVPHFTQQICELFENGEIKKAQELYYNLLPLMRALFCDINPIPVKAALNLLGIKVGECRLPLTSTSVKNKHLLKKVMKI